MLLVSITALITAFVIYLIIPVVTINNEKYTNVNSIVRLELDQTAKLKISNVSVKLLRFTNSTCPTGSKCFWSGQAVEYELNINGKKYATGSVTKAVGTDYGVETINSDYKTYAEIKIIKAKSK